MRFQFGVRRDLSVAAIASALLASCVTLPPVLSEHAFSRCGVDSHLWDALPTPPKDAHAAFKRTFGRKDARDVIWFASTSDELLFCRPSDVFNSDGAVCAASTGTMERVSTTLWIYGPVVLTDCDAPVHY